MIRPYNLGRTERGTASAQLDRFTKTANLITGEATSVAHAVYEIDDYTQGTSRYDVKRPTEDSLTNAQVVFSRGHPVEADTVFQSAFCDGDDLWVAFDDTDGTPSVGDDVGTKADEYKMFKDQTGFKCVAYNATEGLCLVRPFSSGGAVDSFVEMISTTEQFTYSGTNLPNSNASYSTDWVSTVNTFDMTASGSYTLALDIDYYTKFTFTPSGAVTSFDLYTYFEFAGDDNVVVFTTPISRLRPQGYFTVSQQTVLFAYSYPSPGLFDQNDVSTADVEITKCRVRFFVNSGVISIPTYEFLCEVQKVGFQAGAATNWVPAI